MDPSNPPPASFPTRESTPSVEVNPPAFPPQTQNDVGDEEPKKSEKDVDISDQSPPTKRCRTATESSKGKDITVDDEDATMASIPTPGKKQEINLLKDIIEFHNKNGTYPFDDSNDMIKFYKQWINRRAVYAKEDVMSNKMAELHERFLMNVNKTIESGEDIEDWMDKTDVKIYRLSYRIWGKKDDTQDSSETTVSDD